MRGDSTEGFYRGMHYRRSGDGQPLLLVHGMNPLGGDSWGEVVALLGKRFAVFAVDLPGFGSSAPPLSGYSAQSMAGLLADFLQDVVRRRCALVGLSLGGRISVELALTRPDLLSRLVLVASVGLQRFPRVPLWLEPLAAQALRLAARTPCLVGWVLGEGTYDRSRLPAEQVGSFGNLVRRPQVARQYVAAARIVGEDPARLRPRLPGINVPTLLIWGRQDRTLPLRNAYRFLEAIPGARLQIIEECGHTVPLERPHELAAAITAFVETVETREATARPQQTVDGMAGDDA